MLNSIEKVLFDQEKIRLKIKQLGQQISEDYRNKKLLLISILKGSVIFLSDLIREITIPCEIDFLMVSSYDSKTCSSGIVKVLKNLDRPIDGYNVLIVEDILDTGITLDYVTKMLKNKNPLSIKVCTLLDKPSRRVTNIVANYYGFEVPNEFVVGYGLDYNQLYRNLPFIGVLKPSVYKTN